MKSLYIKRERMRMNLNLKFKWKKSVGILKEKELLFILGHLSAKEG
jgi:hypothetical protein